MREQSIQEARCFRVKLGYLWLLPLLVVCDPLCVNYRQQIVTARLSVLNVPGNLECANLFVCEAHRSSNVRSVSASGKLVEDYGNGDLQRLRLIVDLSKVDTGWFTSNVDACRDILPTIHPISSWANYLRHVRPHAVKPLARKRALVAHTLDGNLPGRSLIPDSENILRRPERIAQPLVTVRLLNRHYVRIFLDAPHASNTLVLQRFESAKAASENPVNARSA